MNTVLMPARWRRCIELLFAFHVTLKILVIAALKTGGSLLSYSKSVKLVRPQAFFPAEELTTDDLLHVPPMDSFLPPLMSVTIHISCLRFP